MYRVAKTATGWSVTHYCALLGRDIPTAPTITEHNTEREANDEAIGRGVRLTRLTQQPETVHTTYGSIVVSALV